LHGGEFDERLQSPKTVAGFAIWNVKKVDVMSLLLQGSTVQLYVFSIHEWEQPNSQFGMSKAR
jgi:hypothetical protein